MFSYSSAKSTPVSFLIGKKLWRGGLQFFSKSKHPAGHHKCHKGISFFLPTLSNELHLFPYEQSLERWPEIFLLTLIPLPCNPYFEACWDHRWWQCFFTSIWNEFQRFCAQCNAVDAFLNTIRQRNLKLPSAPVFSRQSDIAGSIQTHTIQENAHISGIFNFSGNRCAIHLLHKLQTNRQRIETNKESDIMHVF